MHIVLFIGGESPAPDETESYFSRMGPPSFTVAADSGLDTLDGFAGFFGADSFRPDVIIGDMDSLKDRSLLDRYGDARKLISPADKDLSDTELGLLECASRRKSDADLITLIGGNGGRADHFIGIYETFSTDVHANVWLCGKQAAVWLGDGWSVELDGLSPSDCVSIARTAGCYGCGSIESEGLEWGSGAMRKSGMPSLSNRISRKSFEEKSPVSVSAKGASFLVFAPISSVTARYGRNRKKTEL
ncbi:MAG: hypothetical protein II547_04805 [Treponema sp.]|nr:hypothetical protein [Treponema sp.]